MSRAADTDEITMEMALDDLVVCRIRHLRAEGFHADSLRSEFIYYPSS
jgi:hypothetical protein